MEYRFILQPIPDGKSPIEQVSKGLERLTEVRSREKMPGIWKITDRLNSIQKSRLPVSAARRNFRRVMALLCWLLGVFALIPALVAPGELLSVLIAGAAAFGVGTGMLWALLPKTLGVLSLAVSLLLLMGSLGNPEELGNLLGFGILMLLLGLAVLVSRLIRRESPYDRAARELALHARDFMPDIDSFWFLPDGITATRETDASQEETPEETRVPPESLLSYDKVERVVETADYWIVIIDEKALLLQKQELTKDLETFPGFLQEHGVRMERL